LRVRPRAGNLQEVLDCLQESFGYLQERSGWLLLLMLVRSQKKGLRAHERVWDEGDQQPYFLLKVTTK